MCMGCMANGDFLLTSGILGAASVRVGLRRYLPGLPTWPRKVTDDEASEFVASLAPPTDAKPDPKVDAVDAGGASATNSAAGEPRAASATEGAAADPPDAGDAGAASASATHRVLSGR